MALVDDNTKIVPANGPDLMRPRRPEGAAQDVRDAFSTGSGKLLRKGMGPDEGSPRRPPRSSTPSGATRGSSSTLAFKSLWGHFAPDA